MTCRATFVLVTLLANLPAQGPPDNGPRPLPPRWFALQNARVVIAPGQQLERATVVLRDAVITAVGAELTPPAGATTIDCTGLSIYPGLIEPFFASDVPALDPSATEQHWNPMIQPQRAATDGALVPAADRTTLRQLGFTVAAVAPSGGILKGTAAVVLLDEPQPTAPTRIVHDRPYAVASLQQHRAGYPGSEMGAIALLRQSLLDAQWYERCQQTVATDSKLADRAPAPSAVLQAIADQRRLPLWLDSQDELQALRLLRIAAEFERKPVLVGSGMEFRRLQALTAWRVPMVIPLQFPDAPDVATAHAAAQVSLRQLQSWEQAPTNSKRLLDAGVPVAWTTARLRDRKDFAARVRTAIACGVSHDQALAALTTVPAGLLGLGERIGTIAPGKLANLVVTTGPLFDAATKVRSVFVGGIRHEVEAAPDRGLSGSWSVPAGWPGPALVLTIDGDRVTAKAAEVELKVQAVQREATTLHCRVQGQPLGDGQHWLRLWVDGAELSGICTVPDGSQRPLRATRIAPSAAATEAKQPPKEPPFEAPPITPLPVPLGGYGFVQWPAASEFVLVGAVLWTGDGRGCIQNGALLVRGERIVFAGPRDQLPELPAGITVIDATGKHVTPGLIDCHSHTGIARGVNESGQAVTAEVRIQDVLDPDDVNWYRQLAGGVTTVNQLHGSANAIGGQSQTTKNRFGAPLPEQMHFAGAPAGIKWALGENPRRANGGGGERGQEARYPNTRMGVEALLRDRFAAADVYRAAHAAYDALEPRARAAVLPPRRDLELEAIAEILAGRRWIHCHSYRQDEIFMLCNLARERGLKIGTFQHVLEGYKVADAIAANALGASSFTDWWAYKFEVYDAIPDNGAILREAGAVVSFNSDSNEHARRLNTEAGKAVKYGEVPAADALDFVTRNPAIQLGIFDRTGSLTAGKDADLVLWSANPLSYAARCEATWVDGRPLFSLAADAAHRAAIATERQRLLQKALASGGERKAREGDPKDAYWAAEDLTETYCCREHEGGR
ncbi:MAG: amidohydrolase family protein [Planctomycetes bacterium]|jgi:imidazolonepropionase-like amidohydrolase|nr:amidohydrolase family protein [Planctomycetota bacterium]